MNVNRFEKRSEARELMMKAMYQMNLLKDFSSGRGRRITEEHDLSGEESYLDALEDAFLKNRDEVNGLIDQYSVRWKTSRMSPVDLAILQLAICEIKYMDDIPVKVSIYEAVELAKTYGTDKASKFINGILGRVVREQL